MQIKTVVEGHAEVARVVALREGDVYKRLTLSPGSNEARMLLGIVTGVMHNGETAAVTAIELDMEWGTPKVEIKAFHGTNDLMLYPAKPEELELHAAAIRESLRTQIRSQEEALNRLLHKQRTVEDVLGDMRDSFALRAAPYEVIEAGVVRDAGE